jgi:hypothetical protein
MIALFLGLLVASCGLARSNQISKMDGFAIRDVADGELCNPYVKGRIAAEERQRRELGDCTPAHINCVKNGFTPGTSGYLSCRQLALQHNALEQQKWQAMTQAGIEMMKASQQRPIDPPAMQPGNNAVCADNLGRLYRC